MYHLISIARFLAISIVSILLMDEINAESIQVSGILDSDTTWSADTVKVMDDTHVPFGNTLNILPGTVIEFQGHYKLTVDGTLIARGGVGDTIVFTTNDPASFALDLGTDGSWAGIWFNELGSYNQGPDTSFISHCRIEYAKYVVNLNQAGGAGISIYQYSRIVISNNIFENNYGKVKAAGVTSWGASHIVRDNLFRKCEGYSGGAIASVFGFPLIKGNVIINNSARYGAAIYGFNSNMTIEDNIIKNNYAISAGGAIYFEGTSGQIKNNEILMNTTNGDGGGIFFEDNSGASLINNLITNNNAGGKGGGFYCFESSPDMLGNAFYNNSATESGGGLYLKGMNSVIQNNTFAYNDGTAEGGAIYFYLSSPKIVNTLIWENTASSGSQVYIQDQLSDPDFNFSDVQGGTAQFFVEAGSYNGLFEDCINLDPAFKSTSSGSGSSHDAAIADWQYQSTSPCINSAQQINLPLDLPSSDYEGNSRIKHGYLDIGAIEAHNGTLNVCDTLLFDENWVADTVILNCNILIEDDVTLTIAPGTRIESNGLNRIRVDGTIIAEGDPDNPILFTSQDTTIGWKGILFDDELQGGNMYDNDTSRFSYCIFEYVRDTSVVHSNYFSSLVFQDVIFRNNSGTHCGGIYGTYSNLLIENCLFENNMEDGLIYPDGGAALFFLNSSPIIRGNSFIDNQGLFNISLEYCNSSQITDNLIHNSSQYGILIRNSNNVEISRNRIFNSGLYAISTSKGSYLLEQNLICNNYSGVSLNECDPGIVINNTIANNQGFGIISNGRLKIYNSIITGNEIENVRSVIETIVMNNLFEDPVFVSPTAGAGHLDYNGMTGDWTLQSISPAIDKGIEDIPEADLPENDLAGNPRVINGMVDIGAFESETSYPVITRQPQNSIVCEGETVTLWVKLSDTAYYQWNKDGTVIPDANTSVLDLGAVDFDDQGNYYCEISNSFGKIESNPAYVLVREAPVFLSQPSDLWTADGKSASFTTQATGSNMQFQWYKDGLELTDETAPVLGISNTSYTDEGMYSCVIGNNCGSDTTSQSHLYIVPQICMVTVSSISGYNLIIWEKESQSPVEFYKIYRESVAAGIYDHLITVGYDELSLFTDTIADPTVQAYIYKITAVDTAGNETDIDLCRPHKTIHLIVTTNPELQSTQLQWDRYYGFDYHTYTIYRSATGVNFSAVHSLSANLNSWTDPDPSGGDLFYRIGVEKPDPCNASGGGKKAGTGPYQHALSNMDDNKLKAGENPPDSIILDNFIIDENGLPGSLVGRLSTIDPDTIDYHTYHLVEGEGDDDNLSFALLGDLLVAANGFDYETKNIYLIRVRSTDNVAFFIERTFQIQVKNVEENSGGPADGSTPPTSLTISNDYLHENNLFGDLVGRLVTIDTDTFDVHTYHLVTGTGADDNLSFTILGDLLIAAQKFDFEVKNTYSIRVRSTDLAKNTIESVFLITIVDADETVGIIKQNQGEVRVYPNPFSGSATVEFPNPDFQIYDLKLMDLSGKILMQMDNITGSRFIIHRNNLERGYYILELRGTNIYRQRIVIE
ncbi:right-handed parallel beta-helix repeat-containing protein [Bacteroidota bacterium]